MVVYRFCRHPYNLFAAAVVTVGGFAGLTAATAAASTAPTLTANGILPNEDSPIVGQTVYRSSPAVFSDPDAVITFQWQRCSANDSESCVPILGATDAGYTPGPDDAGQYLEILERATNGSGYAESPSNLTLQVVWGPPANVAAPTLDSTTPTRGVTLHAGAGTWSYTDTVTRQWQRCADAPLPPRPTASRALTCTDILGADTLDYTPGAGDVGKFLRLVETATGPGGTNTKTSVETDAVAGLPPFYEPGDGPWVVPSGPIRAGVTLIAATGTWTDADSLSVKWQRCVPALTRPTDRAASAGFTCTNIDGATGTTYTTTGADAGKLVRAVVTATNAWGTTNAYTDNNSVSAAPPSVVTAPGTTTSAVAKIEDLDVAVGGRLAPDLGSFADADAVSFQYQRCSSADEASCADIPGATDPTYTPTSADVGYRLRVVATATNAGGTVEVASPMTKVVTVAAAEPTKTTTGAPAPVASTPKAATPVPVQTAPRVCVSRRSVTLHWRLPRGAKAKAFTVTINGKRVATLKGDRRSTKVALTGRPAQQVTVAVTATTRSGAKLRTTRRYQTCVVAKDAAKPLATLTLKRA